MAPRSRGGGSLSAGSTAGAQGLNIQVGFRVEGLDKTDAEFKRIRREVNGRMRDVVVRVGERRVLPDIQRRFPRMQVRRSGGLAPGAMAQSLYVKRDRAGVFIGSRLRRGENRALGWIDFGGKRDRDHSVRAGRYTIVRSLDSSRPLLDRELLDALLDEFKEFT